VVVDVLVFRKDFIEKHPKVVKATVDSFFEALDLLKRDPLKVARADGQQRQAVGRGVRQVRRLHRWQDRETTRATTRRSTSPSSISRCACSSSTA
jgi:NitT/TauT family transport system substrate-binding protein